MLRFMPVSLLLRADEAEWSLPPEDLPSGLPPGLDKRGLFQLQASSDYLRVPLSDGFLSVRRTSFAVEPADSMTVYAAQGSTFDAVIADMERPPHMDLGRHWLACYVMLSRARTLEGLLILRPARREDLSARPPQYLLDELERLEKVEAASLEELRDYIRSLPTQIPPVVSDLLQDDAPLREAERIASERAKCARGIG